jgi:hypothetical protein
LDYEQAIVRRKHGDVSHASFCAGRGEEHVPDGERLCSLVLAKKERVNHGGVYTWTRGLTEIG